MGTNFYILSPTCHRHHGFLTSHIGKRSAAGLWCWDCSTTLCPGGIARIHYGDYPWYDSCPKCGKKPVPESVRSSAAGRELGFNHSIPEPKSGVASCSSFSWAIDPGALEVVNEIEDEYRGIYTRDEFLQILKECPVQFFHMIGADFS